MTEQLRIIRATRNHLDDVASLFDSYRDWYGQPSDLSGALEFIGKRLEQQDSVIFLALRQSVAVGFVQLYPSFSSVAMRNIWVLNDLFVEETSRQVGVASSLMDEAERFARETGAARLDLETAEINYPARTLYEKRGWVRDDEFLHYRYHL